ncbi:MAG: efflux RND transporter permease subunit [Verrucomicrobiales bacterium]|nr:efflux RND transporter permease subunit [Verrucomicrobiales bacterium]
MSLPEFCIRRPIFAVMLNLLIVLFGVVGYLNLPVRELPDVDPPIVAVTTIYQGANAGIMESEVTERLEQEINTIPGIKTLTSISRDEVSLITVSFNLDVDVDVAAQDVRDRISRARALMPEDIEEPVVAKQDANAQEVMWIALYSERFTTLELTDIAERQFKDRLQTVPGVGGINLGGEKRQAIRLRLDATRMAAMEVTAADIARVLRMDSVELPAGRLENLDREMTVRALGKISRPEEFEQLVIRYLDGAPVRLREVATVEFGVEDENSVARYNGQPSVGLGVVKQSEANAVEVADLVKAEVERIKPNLPPAVHVDIAYDSSTYVKKAIAEVKETVFIAFALVLLVMLLFLRNFYSTIIPMLAVPVSLVGVFAMLSVLGYSVNLLTLLALVLAVGVVVDDAIVVLENIYRHVEEGMQPFDAAIRGMKEITSAVIAITITLIVVFVPIAFQSSATGVLFREFAFATAGAVAISAFVALTLTPTMCARILRPPGKHGRIYNALERGLKGIENAYNHALGWAVRRRFVVVLVALATLGITGFWVKSLPQEFLPDDDKGYVFAMIFAPEGSTSEYTDRMVRQAEDILGSYPEVEGAFSAVALARGAPGESDFGIVFGKLKEGPRRTSIELSRPGGIGSIFTRLINEIKGANAVAILPKSGNFGEQYQLVLQGPELEHLEEVAKTVRDALVGAGFVMQPRINLNFEQPQLQLNFDRDLAASQGVSVRDMSQALQILWGGLDLARYNRAGKEYKVIAQLKREDRLAPPSLEDIYVRNGAGELVKLSSFILPTESGSANAINRFARQRAVTIAAQPRGVSLGEAVNRTEALLKEVLPPDVNYRWTGEADEIKEGGAESIRVFILAVLIIYMVLAAQFESLRHPFTIMLALPLALFGALGGIWLLATVNQFALIKFYAPLDQLPGPIAWLTTHLPEIPAMTLNVYSLIGLVLLLGLVTKNSILLVEFANQRMARGANAVDAMLDAGRTRLRPILMTAVATIVGILPVALGLGEATISRRALGVAVVGGMTTSTFLTLFVVPVVYILLSGRQPAARPADAPAPTPVEAV